MSSGRGDAPRCAVLVGPYLSGKTSLFESLLHRADAIEKKGAVKDGTTVGDSSDESRKRHASTELSVGHGTYLDDPWVFIDTPGSPEFTQDARNACMVADVAIVVVDPESSKIVAAAPILQFLDAHDIPHMIFINKMDHPVNAVSDLMAALQDVSERPLALRQVPLRDGEEISGYVDLVSERAYKYEQGQRSALIQLPEDAQDEETLAREELLETLADFDDALLEKLLEDVQPDKSDVYEQFAATMGSDLLVPVLLGAGELDHGVERLMKALRHDCPTHETTAARLGMIADEPVAQVFKTVHAAHMGKLSLVRVWNGAVKDGETLNDERVSGINALLGAKLDKQGQAAAGDVVAFGRMEQVGTGDVLTPSGSKPDGCADWPDPIPPVYSAAVTATNRNDEVKLSGALQKLAEEDTSVSIEHNAELHELVLRGQGDNQMRVLTERLENRFNLSVESNRPSVGYRETIKKQVEQHARHKKQSGGHGQFGDVKVTVKPLPRGSGFQFSDTIVGGAIPKQYIPSVQDGVAEYMKRGPLGFGVVDVAVQLIDGSYHAVDSSDMAFKTAGRMAMSEALPKCGPVLLEPIMQVEISVPNTATAGVQRVITGRRGQILGFGAKENWKGWDVVQAYMPEAEIHDLIVELRSLSLGVGTYTWEFDHLAELTGRLADQVVQKQQDAAH